MRLWSIHPKYLDSKGLVACWREGLLAQKVLEGNTKGYKNHSQLIRFKNCSQPIEAIGHYLMSIYEEAHNRGYNFDFGRISHRGGMRHDILTVTEGQLDYEWRHLENKLCDRHAEYQFNKNMKHIKLNANEIESHPLFEVVKGKVEEWEKIS